MRAAAVCLFFVGVFPPDLSTAAEAGAGEAVPETVRLRVATWNVENYLVMNRIIDGRWRPDYPKPESEKTALRQVIAALDADILALQEMGTEPFLRELQRDLAREGMDYPYALLMEGDDPVRHVAVLSRVPPVHAEGHADLDFPYLHGRIPMKRGLQEIHFETEGVRWILFNIHLKSRYTDYRKDPRSLWRRTAEARVARDSIRRRHGESGTPYMVIGDFNDTTRSAPVRRFLTVGDRTLTVMLDATDRNGQRWTHHWAREDVYSRVDYILVSPALLPHVAEGRAWIFDHPHTGAASDHRPVVTELVFPAPASAPQADAQ
ncbi:MAG: endonuclease/exonuclease/phosphatase family protein [Opitutales bacterium]|nr:endonuclease/exonuclease/phosphatase family protein [Opitutales bacterium]